ncbi:MAG: GNAT family N-acetyltransferase [Thermoplasmata archaeon]
MPTTQYRLRPARATDVETLIEHRHRMFSDIGGRTESEIAAHDTRYRRWLRARLKRGDLVGQIAETRRGDPAASGCLWFRPDQPRPENLKGDVTPYILSMYTAPEHRGRGLASRITRALVAEAEQRGHWQVTLHASPQGRPIYARIGFERRWEMRYWIDPDIHAAGKRSRSSKTRARSPKVLRR